MAQLGMIPEPAVRNTSPDPDDYGQVTRPIITALPVVTVTIAQPSTAAVTTVPVDNVATPLLAANANRLGAMFYNDSPQRLYIKLGAGPTTASFTVQLSPQGYFELPFPVYTGAVTAIRAVGPATNVQVTELA